MLVGYFAGLSTSPAGRYMGWVAGLISLVMLFFGILEKKKQDPADFTFGRGWVEGVLISLIASVFVAIFFYIYADIINPEMMEYARSEAQKRINAGTMPKEQIEQAKKMVDLFTSAPILAVMTLVMYTIFGMIMSLIFTPIVRSMGGNSNTSVESV